MAMMKMSIVVPTSRPYRMLCGHTAAICSRLCIGSAAHDSPHARPSEWVYPPQAKAPSVKAHRQDLMRPQAFAGLSVMPQTPHVLHEEPHHILSFTSEAEPGTQRHTCAAWVYCGRVRQG